MPPDPSRRYSPFMCTPSKASGALPITTDWTSFIVIPAEASAMLDASYESSLPVSSSLLLKRVMPAPITATLLLIIESRREYRHATGRRRDAPPGLHQRPLRALHL